MRGAWGREAVADPFLRSQSQNHEYVIYVHASHVSLLPLTQQLHAESQNHEYVHAVAATVNLPDITHHMNISSWHLAVATLVSGSRPACPA